MNRKSFLVIGLGILGQTIAKTLTSDGAEVVAVDEREELIEQIKEFVSVAIKLDVTDRKAIQQLDIPSFDAVVVCIGRQFDASILVTAHLLDLGVRHVKVRANNETVESILKRLGAHEVFRTEFAMGKIIAHKLNVPTMTQEMDIGNHYRIVQWQAPPGMLGRTLSDLKLPRNFHVQVIAITNPTDQLEVRSPAADTVLKAGDHIFISGHERDLGKLFEFWRGRDEV
jgi:trk system potassium uptake protein